MKEELLADATAHVSLTRGAVTAEIEAVGKTIEKAVSDRLMDESVRAKLFEHFSGRLDQLHHLFPNPYFVRCDLRDPDGVVKTVYFSKFPFMEKSIFSWMAPAARMRFEEIGPKLARKDQFMIVGGRIVFMTSEAEAYGRTLVHQEKLSQRKPGFMLPEIVAKMEAAQDEVIRAPADGSFLIAGPAGSGKTTLAFHRIAYLLQSPDTAERFSSRNVIVFVQDEGTRAYFSKLLPDLGIHDVMVTTFGAWALERLGLEDVEVVRRPSGVDDVIDAYEGKKRDALRSGTNAPKGALKLFDLLRAIYGSELEDDPMFKLQVRDRQLDRFDLSVLLRHAHARDGAFRKTEEYFEQKKNFEVRRKQRSVPLTYSLIVADEAQNYLPEQIEILRSCVSEDTRAMLYVGDLGQQVLLGTVRDWSDVGENFSGGRKVELEKVYRNTQAILRFVASLGFDVSVPEGLREGAPVVEAVCSAADELERIRSIVDGKDADAHVGIVSPSAEYLAPYRAAFAGRADVHVLTIHEAQSVEFDAACLVGIPDDFFRAEGERLATKRDLLYVALTRAMEELYVFGRSKLSDIV